MNAPLIAFVWLCVMLFIGGCCCGLWIASKRYARAIEDRDAEAKRASEAVSCYMMQGVDFNKQILGILQAQGAMPRTVTIDWTLLTQAANGAGFTLVKAEPRATERVN